jgi:2-polyprenyl-3-methyl-5-hydroxy-6-metoxy-1,4-benzoquinol methylase
MQEGSASPLEVEAGPEAAGAAVIQVDPAPAVTADLVIESSPAAAPAAESILLSHPKASVWVTPLPSGKNRINVQTERPIEFNGWETAYSVDLIRQTLEVIGPFSVCDEIARDESPEYTGAALKWALLSYMGEEQFANKRILDFGCGSGASTVTLGRMFPSASLVGIELRPAQVALAAARAEFLGVRNARFAVSPNGTHLPADIGKFDFIVLCAVYEHLLPAERSTLLPALWDSLETGGVLFLRETPHRYFPIETHTTGLPLINYLPDAAARLAIRLFSKRWRRHDWQELLRGGVRGGTQGEILKILKRCAGGEARVLAPCRLGVEDRIDLWYLTAEKSRHGKAKRLVYSALKRLHRLTGIEFAPYLEIALQKQPASEPPRR